jgi:hypothetical protein
MEVLKLTAVISALIFGLGLSLGLALVLSYITAGGKLYSWTPSPFAQLGAGCGLVVYGSFLAACYSYYLCKVTV